MVDKRGGSKGYNFAMQGDKNVDPLRFTNKTTWALTDKALAENISMSHLPTPAWAKDQAALEAEYEKKGLPAPMGRRYKWDVPETYNKVSW